MRLGAKGIYSSGEASWLTIYNFANKLYSDKSYYSYKSLALEILETLDKTDNISTTFNFLDKIAELAKTDEIEQAQRIRRIALALSYSEEKEEDFASKLDLEWIPRVKEGLTSYGLESMEYQTTEDASNFQEAWIFPGAKIEHPELGCLLIGVDYELEPRTARPIEKGKVALSVFFETIVPDSFGTATKHILPLYLILVNNRRISVRLGILKLRARVGFPNPMGKLLRRFEYIKSTKA